MEDRRWKREEKADAGYWMLEGLVAGCGLQVAG
jgi:hypothetical protein